MTSEIEFDVPEGSRIIGSVVVTLVEPPEGEALILHHRSLNPEVYPHAEMLPVTAKTLLRKAIEAIEKERHADDVV